MAREKNTRKRLCCRLVRCDQSSRSSLPLARRGRPHLPSRSRHPLCRNCLKIKRQQENDILKTFQQPTRNLPSESHAQNIFETITDLNQTSNEETKYPLMGKDIPHEIEFSLISENDQLHLNNSEYESSEMLVWKMNTSNQTNTIDASYDIGSLRDNEKKMLLQEAVEKLQIVLRNRSTSTSIPDSDLDQIEFTYRALQTTVDILSSSLDAL